LQKKEKTDEKISIYVKKEEKCVSLVGDFVKSGKKN
jgi:hypothetical protein